MAPPTINAQQWIISLDPCAGNRLIMNHSRGRRPSSFTRLWRNDYFYPLNFVISNELISFKYAHEVALRQHHLLIAFHPSDACSIRSEDTRQIQNLRCVTFILFWGVLATLCEVVVGTCRLKFLLRLEEKPDHVLNSVKAARRLSAPSRQTCKWQLLSFWIHFAPPSVFFGFCR